MIRLFFVNFISSLKKITHQCRYKISGLNFKLSIFYGDILFCHFLNILLNTLKYILPYVAVDDDDAAAQNRVPSSVHLHDSDRIPNGLAIAVQLEPIDDSTY